MHGSIFIIGAGAVGSSLAVSLAKNGARISGIHDRAAPRVFSVAGAVGSKAFLTDELPEQIREAQTVIVAVPEGQLEAVATEAASLVSERKDQVWLHTSGALGPDALAPLKGRVSGLGVLHPVWVFPQGLTIEIPEGTFFGFAGDAHASSRARDIVALLEGRWLAAPSDRRAEYHAAMVLASNYQAALLSVAGRLLGDLGIDPEEAEDVVLSLGMGAMESLQQRGLAAGLSGPVRRGDSATVKCHLEALRGDVATGEVYRSLGKVLVEVVRREEFLEEERLTELSRIFGANPSSVGAGEPDDD